MNSDRASKNQQFSLQRGFSVVELMVAMAVSLLLLAGVLAIFDNSRHSYETTQRLSRVQDTGRFALDRLVFDIQRAGFVGCARVPTYIGSSLNNPNDLFWNFMAGAVQGSQATGAGAWTPALHAWLVNPTSMSDVLAIRVPSRAAEPIRITANMAATNSALQVQNAANVIQTGDVALAYSCEGQAYFHVTAANAASITHSITGAVPGNASDALAYRFRANAEVVPIETVVYYVRPSTADPNTNSLWRAVWRRGPPAGLQQEELVEGVEQMQILYGFDNNGDQIVDNYVTANLVTDWTGVYSVRVALLVRSLEQYGMDLDQQPYQLLDVAVPAANDRRIRQVFTATATLRNRIRQ